MKTHFARAVLAAALLCSSAGAALLIPTTSAIAADEPKVSHDVGEALNEAIKAAQAKDFKSAMAAVQKADAVSDKTAYDQFKINQIKGFIAIQQKDYATATQAYEGMVSSPAFAKLDPKQQQTTLHNAIILSAQAKHWPQVIADSKMLEKFNAMNDKSYATLAQAYYFNNDYANAEKAAQKSVDMAKAKGIEPQLASLEIIMSAQAKSNDQAAALKTLEQIALYYGKPSDWGQLIDHALGTKGMTELDGLYLYRLRFFAGATSAPDDYTIAAGIALHNGYPAEAQSILEKGLAKGVLDRKGKVAHQLAQAREGARSDERSLPSIAKQAERSKYGEQDIKLAEDYWGYGRYADAVAAAKRGIAKGHLKDASEGQFILGISLTAEGKYAAAEQALAQVDGSAARAKAANLWDLYAKHMAMQNATSASAPPPAQK